RLEGTLSIADLPPHRAVSLAICFFHVETADAAPPYDGDPPADVCTNCVNVCGVESLEKDIHDAAREWHFVAERPAGYYYVQVREILYRTQRDRMFAQVEQFFFRRRPLLIVADRQGTVTLPVEWPAQPLEELHHYGTVYPKNKRPWWRFWR